MTIKKWPVIDGLSCCWRSLVSWWRFLWKLLQLWWRRCPWWFMCCLSWSCVSWSGSRRSLGCGSWHLPSFFSGNRYNLLHFHWVLRKNISLELFFCGFWVVLLLIVQKHLLFCWGVTWVAACLQNSPPGHRWLRNCLLLEHWNMSANWFCFFSRYKWYPQLLSISSFLFLFRCSCRWVVWRVCLYPAIFISCS